MISKPALNKIKKILETELLKRGFTAGITMSTENLEVFRIRFKSEPFQTTPVIFKSLILRDYGSSVVQKNEYEKDVFLVWININVEYQLFTGGKRNCDLFSIRCEVNKNRVYNLKEN